jgi:ATP-dependent Lon protease
MGYDLSKVMFIATSNMGAIQPALRDRMEIIKNVRLHNRRKVEIAKQHLFPAN